MDPSSQRLERLVQAGIRINAERALDRVLQEVADSAREVIGARYVALGVLDESRSALSEFVTSGLTPEEHGRIGALPTGKGILGLLIADPRPIRLSNLSSHPRSHGFPSNHPRMTSFLGAPIVGRSGPIGNLYLTEKIGAEEFTAEDEAIAVMLAAQAAVAVENARLYEGSERLLLELRGLQQSRDRFFAMINHELRNALTAVYGWAQLWLRKAGPNGPRAAQEVYESTERTLGLLNDLLDLSRLDASRLELSARDIDAGDLMREAVRSVEPAASAGQVQLKIRTPPDTDFHGRTDGQRIKQILVNLVTNAVRHSPSGETVTIELEATDLRWRFHVADQGDGIPADQQDQIFEAFGQAGDAERRGTGLGLTVSRRLAQLLGGNLSLESRVGHGSRFTLEIPRKLPGNVKKAS